MKLKKKTKLQLAQEKVEEAVNKTNQMIEALGEETSSLYDALTTIQQIFDKIRNIPSEKKLQYEELKQVRLDWKQQAQKIENDYKKAQATNTGAAATVAALGVGVVTMGPTVAMGFATTFGVASTGTAISSLSGAAATNAALAWLGGGALTAGGGGMAAGHVFLSLAGPVGWGIALTALVASGFLFWKNSNNKNRIENIFIAIANRDVKSYELADIELKERIGRILNESQKLNEGIDTIQKFGLDYNSMTAAQQYELGAYVNLMFSSTQLLINPIEGLLPKFSNADFDEFIDWKGRKSKKGICIEFKGLVIFLSNLLYKIEMDERDKELFWNLITKDKKMLESMNLPKKKLEKGIMDASIEAIKYKYNHKSK